jgi:hypothetical protein
VKIRVTHSPRVTLVPLCEGDLVVPPLCPCCGTRMVSTPRGASVIPTPSERPLVLTASDRAQLLPVAAAVVQVLSKAPSMSLRKLRIAVRGVLGRCTDGNTDLAVRLLGPSVQRVVSGRRAHQLTLDLDKVPSDVAALVSGAGT